MRDAAGLRPRIEQSRLCGAVVEVGDAAGMLARATDRPVDVVAESTLRDPVAGVRVTVATDTSDGVPAYALGAVVRLRRPASGPASQLGDLAAEVGAAAAPAVAVQLLRAAGKLSPAAAVAAGASAAALRSYSTRIAAERREAQPAYRDLEDQVVEDPLTGLRATVRCAPAARGQQVTVRATVPAAGTWPDGSPVLGLARIVTGVLAAAVAGVPRVDLEGGAVLAGDRLVLGRAGTERARPDGLDRIGGLHGVVEQFRDVVAAFTHPERMEFFGARAPRGILLYGPPGTGKTTLARALATEVGGKLVEVQTPDLVTKWLGDSAKHMRQVFDSVKSERRPVVLLFDEFDSVVSYVSDPAGSSGADQERNSMAGVFKQQMNDLLETNPKAIVVATTNYLDRIDSSLIRSGRFDLRIEVPLPDETGRREIFTKVMRREIASWEKVPYGLFAEDVDPAGLAVVSAGMSGADIVEVLRRTQHAAAVRFARGGVAVPISQSDLTAQIRAVRLSTNPLQL